MHSSFHSKAFVQPSLKSFVPQGENNQVCPEQETLVVRKNILHFLLAEEKTLMWVSFIEFRYERFRLISADVLHPENVPVAVPSLEGLGIDQTYLANTHASEVLGDKRAHSAATNYRN
jgi:hypothetical protein